MTRVELEIEGMTRASCATRIARKLNRLEGVERRFHSPREEVS